MRNYAITGTSLYLNKGRSARNRTARSAENIEAVRNAIEEARGEGVQNGARTSIFLAKLAFCMCNDLYALLKNLS